MVAPDETALLTVTVYGLPSSELVGSQFMLQLPHGLMTSAGEQGEVRRPLPPVAPDAPAEPWQEIITLHSNLAGYLVNGTTPSAGYNGVSYDHAGRITQMRFPQGGNLWRTYRYAPFNQQNSDGGMLDAIYLGTTTSLPPTTPATTDYSRLRLEYDYDSFANVKTLREGHNGAAPGTFSFSYDAHNRLTNAFNYAYAYDTAGRITSYEGSALGYDSVKKHAVNTVGGTDRYDYDANGNVTVRHKGLSTQQTLTWSHENRLASLTATGLSESYLYDDAGIRVKKVSGSTTTYYPFPHYEVSGSTITKYYFFAGQRVAMKVNGTLYYLHGDHLSSTAYASTSSGSQQSGQAYYAYGRTRFVTGAPPSDHKFTGQKLDASTGLYYYNARYYDPVIGTFISPDTLVPDPTSVWDYNRFAYARLNPLKYNDPTGHCATLENGAPDLANDGGCWDAANEYLATFGIGGYASEEQWRQYFVSNASITEETLRASLYAHWGPP